MKRLYRDLEHKMAAGICAGASDMLDIDPSIVRLALVFCTVITGFVPGIVAYMVGWFIIPEKNMIPPEEK
jgi:phage shock protein C